MSYYRRRHRHISTVRLIWADGPWVPHHQCSARRSLVPHQVWVEGSWAWHPRDHRDRHRRGLWVHHLLLYQRLRQENLEVRDGARVQVR